MEYLGDFNEKSDILMEKLRKYADGKTVINFLNEINRATLDIISKIFFGMTVESLNNPNNEFNNYISKSIGGCLMIRRDPLIRVDLNF